MNYFFSLLVILFFLNIKAEEQKSIRVGVSPAISSAGLYIAKEKGFFKDEKLNVELVIFNNSAAPMTLLLAKGEIEVGAGNLTAGLFNAINKGHKLKIVADKGHVGEDHKYIALVVRKDLILSGRVKTLNDLKGLKVSLTSLDGSSQQIVLDKMLGRVGLNDKDVEMVKLSYPEAVAALKTKAIDATVTLEPYISQVTLDESAVNFASSQDYLPNQQSGAILYSDKFMNEQKEDALKFMKAYLQGVKYYNRALKDKNLWSEVSLLLNKYNKIENEKIWASMLPVGLDDKGQILTASIQRDLDWYKAKSYIEKIPNESELYDFSFIENANKLSAPPPFLKEKDKKSKNAKKKN